MIDHGQTDEQNTGRDTAVHSTLFLVRFALCSRGDVLSCCSWLQMSCNAACRPGRNHMVSSLRSHVGSCCHAAASAARLSTCKSIIHSQGACLQKHVPYL